MRGEVQIFYGDPASLAVIGPILRPGEDGLPGVRQAGDRFGASLVGYSFDDGGFHDLAVGVPGDGGGRVYLIPGSSAGLNVENGAIFAQQTFAVPDDDDPNDQFGSAVGAMASQYDNALVIGVPGEDTGQGAVVLLKIELDPVTGAFIAIEPATILRPANAGLQLAAQAHWGEVIAPPRAFPTKPVDFP